LVTRIRGEIRVCQEQGQVHRHRYEALICELNAV